MNQADKQESYNSLLEILEMISLKDGSKMLEEVGPQEIFELRESDEYLGKFWSVDLLNMLKSYPTLFSTTLEVKSLNDENWQTMLAHPLFQRRKPEVVPTTEEPEVDSYLVQIDSEIFGPITKDEIEEKLQNNSLLFTDKLSIDDGKTWMPIFKRSEFDRRKRSSEQLPASPESDIFALSQFEAMTNLIEKKENEQQECLNVIAGLAYIGQVHTGKIIAEEELSEQTDSPIEATKTELQFPKIKRNHFWYPRNWIGIFQHQNMLITLGTTLLIIAGLIWALGKSPSKTVSPKTVKSRPIKIYRPKATKITKRSIATTKHTTRRKQPVRRKKHIVKSQVSFLDSDTYQDGYAEDEYDNVEQDAVQASLSKDIIDPEDEMDPIDNEEAAHKTKQLNEEGPDSEIDLFNEEYIE